MNSTGMREFYCLYLSSMKKIQSFSQAILLFFLLLLNNSYGESLENLDNLVEKLSPSVVKIETTSKEEDFNIATNLINRHNAIQITKNKAKENINSST